MRNILLSVVLCSLTTNLHAQLPKVNDDRLKIELFAEAPDIVTPVGIDVDDSGRVYVIESHTHFPKADYKGPKTDRIRIYEDTDGDRKADKITDFHTGETHTMGIALDRHAKGNALFVATRKEIFRLRDTNGDGVADERTSLVKLDTKASYPHNGLSGFAFDFKGDLCFGFGENFGEPYKLIGSDNTTLEGGGEGGNIYTCDREGKKLRRVATGFWNPFHMCFDAFGRLFAVDNDPDSRPPCRLLHIVEGGDYGYRFRYGRKGLHPFTSWNGEIPGTLPMVAGTGEAPSGILAYESDNLPADYLGDLLVTSWGDHRIERYKLKPNGASFTSKMEPVITGDENFRPVGIALAPDGSLYVSDWVDKSYNVHGKGRVWRISAKEEKKVERPDPVKDLEKAIRSKHRPTREKAARVMAARMPERPTDWNYLTGNKPDIDVRVVTSFIQATADAGRLKHIDPIILSQWYAEPGEVAIANWPVSGSQRLDDDSPTTPLMISRWLERSELAAPLDVILTALGSDDPFMAHAASHRLSSSKDDELDRVLKQLETLPVKAKNDTLVRNLMLTRMIRGSQISEPEVSRLLDQPHDALRFVTIQWIAEKKLVQYRQQLTDSLSRSDLTPRLLVATLTALDMLDGGKPQSADHVGGRWYLERLVFGDKTPVSTRAMGLRMLPADNPALNANAIKKLLEVEDERLRIEVVRTLRQSPIKERADMLRTIVQDEKQSALVRAEAVAGLDANVDEERKTLVAMAQGKDELLIKESLRALRGVEVNSLVTTIDLAGRPKEEDVKGWLAFVGDATPQAADAKNGERVFFSAKAGGCYRCHTIGGRGGEAGPDLSTIGKSMTRERIMESILTPSKEIAPRYAAHLVELAEGDKLTLMYVGPSPDGKQIWADSQGKTQLIAPGDIASKEPMTTSIMPQGLHQGMTRDELRDLLAFLSSLQ